jgi:hypothetical protein
MEEVRRRLSIPALRHTWKSLPVSEHIRRFSIPVLALFFPFTIIFGFDPQHFFWGSKDHWFA